MSQLTSNVRAIAFGAETRLSHEREMSVQDDESCGFSENMNRAQRDKASFSEPWCCNERRVSLNSRAASREAKPQAKRMDRSQETQAGQILLPAPPPPHRRPSPLTRARAGPAPAPTVPSPTLYPHSRLPSRPL